MAADIITLQEVGRVVGLGDGAHDRWIIAVGNPHEKRRYSMGNLWETLGKHTINEGSYGKIVEVNTGFSSTPCLMAPEHRARIRSCLKMDCTFGAGIRS